MRLKAYHGSNARFSKFDQGKARIVNDFYGGGVAYFTDNIDVSKSYARTMAKKGGERYVYEVALNFKKVFDVDKVYTGSELTKFFTDKTVENFARGAGLMKLGSDKYSTLANLKSGKTSLTGEKVFKGLSKGMVNTAATRNELVKLGYDGLRYNGGLNMGMATKHSVYLAYNAASIKLVKRYKMVDKVKEQISIMKSVIREQNKVY